MSNTPDDPTQPQENDSIRVAEIRRALIEELRADKSQPRVAIDDIRELKEDALTSLQHTIRHSQNEALKARVSMWALDKVIDAERVNSDDPMTEFLRNLTAETKEANA